MKGIGLSSEIGYSRQISSEVCMKGKGFSSQISSEICMKGIGFFGQISYVWKV